MNIGTAISAMKDGKKVARRNWNGPNQFIYYVPAGKYPAVTEVAKEIAKDNDDLLVQYTPYLAIKTVQNTVAPWLASQTDILADDWYVVE